MDYICVKIMEGYKAPFMPGFHSCNVKLFSPEPEQALWMGQEKGTNSNTQKIFREEKKEKK